MLADYTFYKEKHHLSYIYYIQTYVSITFVYDFVLLCLYIFILFVVVSLIFYILIKNYILNTFEKNRHIIIYISFIKRKYLVNIFVSIILLL